MDVAWYARGSGRQDCGAGLQSIVCRAQCGDVRPWELCVTRSRSLVTGPMGTGHCLPAPTLSLAHRTHLVGHLKCTPDPNPNRNRPRPGRQTSRGMRATRRSHFIPSPMPATFSASLHAEWQVCLVYIHAYACIRPAHLCVPVWLVHGSRLLDLRQGPAALSLSLSEA